MAASTSEAHDVPVDVDALAAIEVSATGRVPHQDEQAVLENPYLAITWAFMTRFSPVQDELTWPQTIHEFVTALQAPEPTHQSLAAVGRDFVPSLEPVLQWCADASRKSSGGHWSGWLSWFVQERMRKGDECRLSDAWEGVNLLARAGGLYALHWQDRVRARAPASSPPACSDACSSCSSSSSPTLCSPTPP
jgi:hypothetical protein